MFRARRSKIEMGVVSGGFVFLSSRGGVAVRYSRVHITLQ